MKCDKIGFKKDKRAFDEYIDLLENLILFFQWSAFKNNQLVEDR